MKAKREFYINYNGIRTQIAAPINWENDKLSLSRHDDINTVVRIVSLDDPIFIFDDTITPVGASTLLQSIFEADGADADATLEVLRLDNDTNDYLPLYEGYLNFKYYSKSGTDKSVSLTLTDSSDLEKFNNRKDISVRTDETTSLDGNTVSELLAHDITLQKQELTRSSSAILNKTKTAELIEVLDGGNTLQTGNSIGYDISNFSSCSILALGLNDDIGYYEALGTVGAKSFVTPATNEIVEVFTCNSTNPVFKLYLKSLNVFGKGSFAGAETSTFTVNYYFYKLAADGTVLDTKQLYDDTNSVSGSFTFSSSATFSDYLFELKNNQRVGIKCTITSSQTHDIDQFSVSSVNAQFDYETPDKNDAEEVTLESKPSTTSVASNQFIDEVVYPAGEEGTILLTNKKEYRRFYNVVLNSNAASLNAVVSGLTSSGVYFYATSYLNKYNEDNTIAASYKLYDETYNGYGTSSILMDSINERIELKANQWLEINDYITIPDSESVYSSIVNVAMTTGAIDLSITEVSPDDSIIEAFDAFEVLSHVSDVILGEGKLVINNDIISLANKDSLNSGYNLHIARGSHIRGFASTYGDTGDAPLSIDFLTLYNSIATPLGLGLEYRDDYFYLDYLTNINTNNIIDIGDVSDFSISSAEDIPKSLTVGDATSSDTEEYYLTNEGHNKTSYAYPTVTAQSTLDYTTEVSTSAIPVELMRRVNAIDTPDLSLTTDSLPYFIKCYDGYTSEKEERITIDSAPDNFGDLNLCFLPSYIIQNNKQFLGMAFFRKPVESVLKFMSSTYGLNLTTSNILGTFVEQSDVLSTAIGSQKSDPIIYSFKMPMTDAILAAVSADPNAKIMFSHNGDTYIGRIKTDTELEIFLENGEWTLEKAN